VPYKNRGATTVIEKDINKTTLQRVGWALPRPFYIHIYFPNETNRVILRCHPIARLLNELIRGGTRGSHLKLAA
jgi:hypothetical protein